jgi:hypothetical protein
MKQQTKNRLKAVYIICVVCVLLGYFGEEGNDQDKLFVWVVAPIPIYWAVLFWTKTPKE